MKPRYLVEPPRYCNRREGWVVEYRVQNGVDVHGATEGFIKKHTFEAARDVYLEFSEKPPKEEYEFL